MKIRVFGASGGKTPGHHLTAFLINDELLLDAGTLTGILTIDRQKLIKFILVTHSHLDHIKEIAFLADNFNLSESGTFFTMASIKPVLDNVMKHLLNDILWPDFNRIPSPDNPVMKLKYLKLNKFNKLDGYLVMPIAVNHTVAAVGYIIKSEADGKTLLFSGDTGSTNSIWEKANGFDIDIGIVETSFPNRLENLAILSGHLTPAMLIKELSKLNKMPTILYITHIKPQYKKEVIYDLIHSGIDADILEDGMTIG